MMRAALVRALDEQADLRVVAQVGDGHLALDEIRRHAPSVAVIDLRMPGLDGLELLAAIRSEMLAVHVLLLSAFADPAVVHAAMLAGAAGYLSKDADERTIVDAVRRVGAGETVLEPTLQTAVIGHMRSERISEAERIELSVRELEILTLTAQGLRAPEIASHIFLSPATVKTYLSRVYEKLGVSDRAAAVAEGMRRGLLQ